MNDRKNLGDYIIVKIDRNTNIDYSIGEHYWDGDILTVVEPPYQVIKTHKSIRLTPKSDMYRTINNLWCDIYEKETNTMTNLEKHKNAIGNILVDALAVTKDGKIRRCMSDNCDSCLFEDDYNCAESIKRWLNADCDESKNHMEIATLIAYLKQEPNQLKKVKSIKIVDGMPVINGD